MRAVFGLVALVATLAAVTASIRPQKPVTPYIVSKALKISEDR